MQEATHTLRMATSLQQPVAPYGDQIGASVELSQPQKLAVTSPINHPLIILAAAGSGKTLVLCHRILHLISEGVDARDILALTFTRKAGNDLRCRVHSVASTLKDGRGNGFGSLAAIRVGTFHSFCLSILRAFPVQAGLCPDFVIFTPKMQMEVLQELVQNWFLGKQGQGRAEGVSTCTPEQKAIFRLEARKIFQRILKLERQKNCKALIDEAPLTDDDNIFSWVYHQYCRVLQDANGVDFNAFIRHAIELFKNYPEALQRPEVRARYVLVDEFQDTDSDQFELLKLLCGSHKCLTIVGDDDQQIYSWRGAAGYLNFLACEEVFSNVTTVKLEQNFRSTGAIVAAARRLIVRNRNRMPKSIRTLSPPGPLLTICECRNEHCEAAAVADQIHALYKQGIMYHDMAVLYRVHRVGIEVLHQLRAWHIPCEFKGCSLTQVDGKVFLDSAAAGGKTSDGKGRVFDDVVAVLRLVVNESDDLACHRLYNLFCQNPSPAVSDCISHLMATHRMPALQAVRCTRSHLLGLLVCKELSGFASAEAGKRNSDSQDKSLGGLHTLLKVVAATKDDLKSMGLRDLVMNVVQQVGPYRDVGHSTKLSTEESLRSGNQPKRLKGGSVGEPREVPGQVAGTFEFAGIKALLTEAASFEKEYVHYQASISTLQRNGSNRYGSKQNGQRKASKVVTLASLEASTGSASNQVWETAVLKVKAFLDNVALRSFEHELGELSDPSSNQSHREVTGSSGATPVRDNVVTLSTIHQAKGLEWTSVILVRANEGVLPVVDSTCFAQLAESPQCPQEAEQKDPCAPGGDCEDRSCLSQIEEELEEERRLFYVALTRARRFVMVTHVLMDGGQQQIASRFLSDIPPGLMQRISRFDSNATTELPKEPPPQVAPEPETPVDKTCIFQSPWRPRKSRTTTAGAGRHHTRRNPKQGTRTNVKRLVKD